MSFRLEDLDLVLGNAGLLTAEQYQHSATPSGEPSTGPERAGAAESHEQGPSDDQEMGEATADVDGQEQEEVEDGDVAMEGTTDNVASTTAATAAGPALVPVAPTAAAANAVPAVLPAVRTNFPIQTRFVGVANILTADIILAPLVIQGVSFTPIARAPTQPPAAITDEAIAKQFCRMWSLQFTARDTRRRANQARLVYDGHKEEMDSIAAATYAVLFQRMGPPSGIHGWRQMTDLVTLMGYEILSILYDHRHVLAPGEFHAHAVALELVRSRDSLVNQHGVLVRDLFTAAGF
ncbi:hypothetical protein DV736_g4177, partial [Chaetothyriales sp. CBS 134916]